MRETRPTALKKGKAKAQAKGAVRPFASAFAFASTFAVPQTPAPAMTAVMAAMFAISDTDE